MDNPVESIRTPDGSHVLSSLKERGATVVSPSVAARLQRSQLQKYIGLVTSSLSRRTVDGYPFDMFAVSVPEFAPSFNSADPLVGGCSMDVLCSLDGNAKNAVRAGNLVLLIGRLTARRVGGKPSFLFHATSVVAILETSLSAGPMSFDGAENAGPEHENGRALGDSADDARADADEIRDRSRDVGDAIRNMNDPSYGIDEEDEEDGERGNGLLDDEDEPDGEEHDDGDENGARRTRTERNDAGLSGTSDILRFRLHRASDLVKLRPDTSMMDRLKRGAIRSGLDKRFAGSASR